MCHYPLSSSLYYEEEGLGGVNSNNSEFAKKALVKKKMILNQKCYKKIQNSLFEFAKQFNYEFIGSINSI